VPGLYAAGDMACVPHNYLLGALTYGQICAENALRYAADASAPVAAPDQVAAEGARIIAPLSRPRGIPHHQYEYKVRRLVNDYLQPPKSAHRLERGLEHFERMRDELQEIGAGEPHELMRAAECAFIRDCAEMAARASLFRTESRWGLYHLRVDHPERDDAAWLCHTILRKVDGRPACEKRPVAPYLVPIAEDERDAYRKQRIRAHA
jgi:succinate dehydrogenase/fumarate reductase flavoprotein subunit